MVLFTAIFLFCILMAYSFDFGIDIVMIGFAILFTIAILYGWWYAVKMIFGSVIVILDNSGGKIFSGIGKVGSTKYFSCAKSRSN